jgi:hypothetical protein
MRDRRDAIIRLHKIAQHFRKVNHTKAVFRGSKLRQRDSRKHAAKTQNNLGLALKTLDERESGTARLEERRR